MVKMDTDFIGFTYNKLHSIRDLNIYRVSEGSRYNSNPVPNWNDKTMENSGGDGTYFFGSTHKNKQFNINIAFDSLTETQLRKLKQLFNGKEVGELIFDEAPYKAYAAKVTGTPQLKTIPFDGNDQGERIYKGEGTITFTCYHPYAYTPDWVWTYDATNGNIGQKMADGKYFANYDAYYNNKEQWKATAKLLEKDKQLINSGEMPIPFRVEMDQIAAGGILTIGNNKITVLEDALNFVWDSYTGLVSGRATEKDSVRLLRVSGQTFVTIPNNGMLLEYSYTQPASTSANTFNYDSIKYQLWYY